MAKLRIIQCGVAGFGEGWLKHVMQCPEVEHAALVDVNAAALAKAAETTGVPTDRCFPSLEAALEKVETDAVLTVTPPPVHYQHALVAFKARKHLITEKPIADTLEHGAEMVRGARDAGVQLMISQNYRYQPQPRLLHRLIADKAAGALVHGDVVFALPADFRGSFRETMEYPTLVDMSIHHFDLMRYIVNANAKSMFVHSFKTPTPEFRHEAAFKSVIVFENDVVFSYVADWTSRRSPATTWNGDWVLQCADGALTWDNRGVTRSTSKPWGREPQTALVEAPNMDIVSQAYSLHEFVRAIQNNTPAETSGLDNLNSFAMVEAALRSIKTGKVVNLADVTPRI